VAAAAAVILIALLLNIPPAGAVHLKRISWAIQGGENVYIKIFDVEKTEPTQEIWVSQASNTILLKNEKERVLLDVKNNFSKSTDLNTGTITIAKVDDHIRAKFQGMMKAPWGLLPSDDIFKVYPDVKWERVPDEDIESPIPDTEVYDLTWIDEKFADRKWRGHVDIKTHLPQKIEWWLKLDEKQGYKRETFTLVSYPEPDEMKAFIKEAGF
jgi:hypothetical protein